MKTAMCSEGRSLLAKHSLQNEHSESLLRQLNEFRKNEMYTDVYLNCGTLRIPAHRNILAAGSPYFQAMFGGLFPESAQQEVQIMEMDAASLNMAVEFIYTGHLELSADSVQQLFCVASFLQLEHLLDLCAEYMCSQLDAENCLGLKKFAEKQNNFALLEAARHFIMSHFKEVVQSEEFLEMSYEELNNIMINDEFYVHSDDAVLRGITRWAAYRPDRLPHLSHLLRYIHPGCINAEAARSIAVLQEDEASSQWLNEALQSCENMEWHIFVLDKMGRTPDLKRFDLTFDESTPLAPLPRAAFAVSLVGHKNNLYAQGGSVGRSTSESFYYNVYRDQWHELHPLLIERSHHRSVVLNDYLYALGGNTLQGATRSVEYLNLVTNKATFRENMLVKRSSMGAVVYENSLYVMGGETDNRALYSAERYDPRTGVWEQLAPMRRVNSYCTSATIGTYIYCCEGLCSCMERYDLRNNAWEIINFSKRSEFYEIFSADEKLFSVSGEAISCFDMEDNVWRPVYKFDHIREWDTAVGMKIVNNYQVIF